MRWLIAAAIAAVLSFPVHAGTIEVLVKQKIRQHRNTGTITLRDPFSNAVLGVYEFATGGFARGSAPFGQYEIGAFRDVNDDPNHIGPRWMIRQPGRADGEAWDPRISDLRTYLELHSVRYQPATMGCMAVVGGPAVWKAFMHHLGYIMAWVGHASFTLAGNPDGDEAVVALAPIGRKHHEPRRHRRHRRH